MTDQTTPLRDRIAAALAREDAHNAGYDHGFTASYGADDETVASGTAANPAMPAPVDRAALSAKLWEIAERHIVAEWICCEPLEPSHDLCAKGYAALGMVKSLLVDADPGEAWNPSAPLLSVLTAVLPPTTNHDTDTAKLAAALREVLDTFSPMHDVYGGPVSYYDGSADITPAQYEGWRAVLDGALRRVADETAAAETCDHDSQVIDHEGAQYWACLKCGTNLGRVEPATGARQNRPPATAYSDGKGRVYCIRCAPAVSADVPLKANDVEPHELCPSCGRHVVDVAASGARQDGAQPT